MKKRVRYIILFSFLLGFSADFFAQGPDQYFEDKDGFFFYIGIDLPKQNVNLVWDEITAKPIKNYILERSTDGNVFIPVIVQSAVNKPRDIREMSEVEQENIQTLNTIIYTTESQGRGRFVFNEPISDDLIHKNYVLRTIISNRIQWQDKQLVESLLGSLSGEQPLIYRIKFIYPDGTVNYSGQRSMNDYLSFILKRALSRISADNAGPANNPAPAQAPGKYPSTQKDKNGPLQPLAACPPVNGPPACVTATGNVNIINGTCCNYTEREYKGEEAGGPPNIPCSQSNNGTGYCTPLILDCPPASSDKCCAGNGCGHYAVCGCKPWECCVYTLPPAWYIVARNDLPPPTASATSSSPPCALGNTTTVSVSGGTANFTYSWSPGGYTSPGITNVTSGNYNVSVTDANGCTATAAVTVNPGNPTPAAIFTANTVCLGQPTVFTNNSTISSGSITGWSWNFGNGNTSNAQSPSHTYTASGTYSVTLIVTSNANCTSTITNVITVNPQPAAGFNVPPVCLGNPTSFTDQSTGGANQWSWNFGDGNTSSIQTPSHTYTASGTYSVTLTVSSSANCSNTISGVVTVNLGPVAGFNASAVCLGNPTSFTDQSSGGASQWSWNFGDGNTSTQQNPSHTYAATGTYSVTLTVSSNASCTATITNIITVNPQPVAGFSVTTVCFGNATQFTDVSTGGATGWTWNFGDGNSSTQQSPANTYTATGTYTVTMNASAAGGCNSNSSQVITVLPMPVANFSATTVCPGFPMQFTDQSTGSVTQWSWNFGNGNTSTQQHPSNTYSASGSYTATLTSTDGGGCNASISQPVTVFPLPVASFTQTDICINTNPAVFTDQSTGATQWTWNFGDGTPNSTQQNPSHIYGAPGTYSVTLIVQSSGACTDTLVQTINVNPVPDANFTVSVACFNNATQFTDQSLGVPNQWLWNFGDPSSGTNDTSSAQNPTHVFLGPGTYTVILVVTNSLGCSDTLPLTAVVNPLPAANFIAPTVCIGSSTCFKDTTTIPSGVISTWSWNFDDLASGSNNTSAIQNPCHLFTAVGTYNVILTTTSNSGCQSTITKPVNVTLPPVASFSVNTVCLNSPTQFTDLSTGSVQWYWNFGDGGTSTAQNPSHVYLGFGSYVVSLIASAGGICTDTITDTITVSPLPIIIFSSDSVCVGIPTSFTDASFIPSGSINAWSWNFGDPLSGINNNSAVQNPTHVFSSAGTYSVTLTATSAAGCQSSKVYVAVVHPGPQAEFSFSPASPVNLTELITFTDLSTGSPVQWWWNFGDKDTSVLQHPDHLYPEMNIYNITLIVTTQNGCTDTVIHPLEILQFSFYIPNAFTPGTDGKNDYFFGKGVGIVEYELTIFDRWGNHIFYCKINDLPQTLPCMWDGKVEAGSSNRRVQQDVFVWKVTLLDIFGESHKYIGSVTVVK